MDMVGQRVFEAKPHACVQAILLRGQIRVHHDALQGSVSKGSGLSCTGAMPEPARFKRKGKGGASVLHSACTTRWKTISSQRRGRGAASRHLGTHQAGCVPGFIVWQRIPAELGLRTLGR